MLLNVRVRDGSQQLSWNDTTNGQDTDTSRFGVIVESLATGGGTGQIVVERAMYSADGRVPAFTPYWPAGTNAVGTRLP